ncbi:MAG: PAS domain-containing protein, partial [Gammaproteobacteria bacterium]
MTASKDHLEKLVNYQKHEINALKHAILAASNDQETFALRELIALMPGNIFWKNKEGYFLGCNNTTAKILGFSSPNEIIGKRSADVMDAKLAKMVEKTDQEIMASNKEKFFEEVGLNENKEPAIYLTHKVPLCNQAGEVIGLLGIGFDISERKKLEQELKTAKEQAEMAVQAKSQFLAVVNHELRTPLTGILGIVNVLKKHHATPEEKEKLITDLENCSQNLLAIVNNVLDF